MNQMSNPASFTPPHEQPAAYAFDPRRKSPALACVLSLMPGLGQIYVGYYTRGFVHAIAVAGIISLLATGRTEAMTPLLGVFLAFFWMYNIIDAGRRAAHVNQVLSGVGPASLPEELGAPGMAGSIAGGFVLIAVGLIALMHTRFGVSLDWVEDWWPVAPIAFGGWLLYKGFQERRPAA